MCETACLWIEVIEASEIKNDPERAVSGFEDFPDIVTADAVGIGRLVLIEHEATSGPVEAVESPSCPDPEETLPVLVDEMYVQIAEAVPVGWVRPIVREGLRRRVKTVEAAVPGGHPHHAVACDGDVSDASVIQVGRIRPQVYEPLCRWAEPMDTAHLCVADPDRAIEAGVKRPDRVRTEASCIILSVGMVASYDPVPLCIVKQ